MERNYSDPGLREALAGFPDVLERAEIRLKTDMQRKALERAALAKAKEAGG
jgi:hypothetical protein